MFYSCLLIVRLDHIRIAKRPYNIPVLRLIKSNLFIVSVLMFWVI